MLDDQATPARLSRWEGIDDQYDARREAMTAKGRMDTVYKPVRAGAAVSRRRGLGGGSGGAPGDPAVAPAAIAGAGRAGRGRADRAQLRARAAAWRRSAFSAPGRPYPRAARRTRQVVIASWSEGARERLRGLMEDQGVQGAVEIRDVREVGAAGRPLPCRLGAGAGLHRAGPRRDLGTGRAGRPADLEAAPQAQGREFPAARSTR